MKENEKERLKHMLEIEEDLYSKGYKLICGVDEAGRGPLCGPVVAAAVILKPDDMIEGVNDSKKVSEKKREKLYEEILMDEEGLEATKHDKIHVAEPMNINMDMIEDKLDKLNELLAKIN